MGPSSGSSGGTTTQTTEPWSGAKPYLTDLYKSAQGAFNVTDKAPWTGPVTANFDPLQTAGNQAALNTIPALQQQGQGMSNLANKTIRGDFLDPSTNPYVTGAINAAFQPTLQAFADTVLPGISDRAIQGGAYGGARHGIAEGTAAQGLGRELLNTASNISMQNYTTERQNQMASPGLQKGAQDALMAPGQIMSTIGGANQQQAQNVINNELALKQSNTLAPWNGLANLSAALNGGGFQSSTMTAPRSGSTGGDILSGIFGGAQAAASLATLFSDRRLKRNIMPLVRMANGLMWYLFKYIWSDNWSAGFMADEVERKFPQAISRVGSYALVDYSLVGGL